MWVFIFDPYSEGDDVNAVFNAFEFLEKEEFDDEDDEDEDDDEGVGIWVPNSTTVSVWAHKVLNIKVGG